MEVKPNNEQSSYISESRRDKRASPSPTYTNLDDLLGRKDKTSHRIDFIAPVIGEATWPDTLILTGPGLLQFQAQ